MVHDVLVIGGGLAGSLAAWRLAVAGHRQPRICVIEGGPTLGGQHTWSFHDTDVPDSVRHWLEPLVAARWQGHDVHFPDNIRCLDGGYASITSERLHQVIAPVLGDRLRLGCRVDRLSQDSVTLDTGETIRAGLVIDSRGLAASVVPSGWQTFLGQELDLETDHDLRRPVLMDATVPQEGGFRFMYLLPWSARRILVEDTLYADATTIDAADRRRRITEYAASRGWRVRAVLREERGALPIPLSGSGHAFWPDQTIRIGVRAGLFHPTTGYSLPDAAATADLLTALDVSSADIVFRSVSTLALRRWRRRAFFRRLNRLLIRAAAPDERILVLQQFYQRPEALIARFYGDRLTWLDQCRLLAGRPPVSLRRAIAQIAARS